MMASPETSPSPPNKVALPRPKSPLELYGKRREFAKVVMLEREIGFLQEELKSINTLQAASSCIKEVADYVAANPEPLIATCKKTRKSCGFWKWICQRSSCFDMSWICCCCCSCLDMLCCWDTCPLPDCCSCSLPKCTCAFKSCLCCRCPNYDDCCCCLNCPSCPDCSTCCNGPFSCWPKCSCPKRLRCSCCSLVDRCYLCCQCC